MLLTPGKPRAKVIVKGRTISPSPTGLGQLQQYGKVANTKVLPTREVTQASLQGWQSPSSPQLVNQSDDDWGIDWKIGGGVGCKASTAVRASRARQNVTVGPERDNERERAGQEHAELRRANCTAQISTSPLIMHPPSVPDGMPGWMAKGICGKIGGSPRKDDVGEKNSDTAVNSMSDPPLWSQSTCPQRRPASTGAQVAVPYGMLVGARPALYQWPQRKTFGLRARPTVTGSALSLEVPATRTAQLPPRPVSAKVNHSLGSGLPRAEHSPALSTSSSRRHHVLATSNCSNSGPQHRPASALASAAQVQVTQGSPLAVHDSEPTNGGLATRDPHAYAHALNLARGSEAGAGSTPQAAWKRQPTAGTTVAARPYSAPRLGSSSSTRLGLTGAGSSIQLEGGSSTARTPRLLPKPRPRQTLFEIPSALQVPSQWHADTGPGSLRHIPSPSPSLGISHTPSDWARTPPPASYSRALESVQGPGMPVHLSLAVGGGYYLNSGTPHSTPLVARQRPAVSSAQAKSRLSGDPTGREGGAWFGDEMVGGAVGRRGSLVGGARKSPRRSKTLFQGVRGRRPAPEGGEDDDESMGSDMEGEEEIGGGNLSEGREEADLEGVPAREAEGDPSREGMDGRDHDSDHASDGPGEEGCPRARAGQQLEVSGAESHHVRPPAPPTDTAAAPLHPCHDAVRDVPPLSLPPPSSSPTLSDDRCDGSGSVTPNSDLLTPSSTLSRAGSTFSVSEDPQLERFQHGPGSMADATQSSSTQNLKLGATRHRDCASGEALVQVQRGTGDSEPEPSDLDSDADSAARKTLPDKSTGNTWLVPSPDERRGKCGSSDTHWQAQAGKLEGSHAGGAHRPIGTAPGSTAALILGPLATSHWHTSAQNAGLDQTFLESESPESEAPRRAESDFKLESDLEPSPLDRDANVNRVNHSHGHGHNPAHTGMPLSYLAGQVLSPTVSSPTHTGSATVVGDFEGRGDSSNQPGPPAHWQAAKWANVHGNTIVRGPGGRPQIVVPPISFSAAFPTLQASIRILSKRTR